jgi:uncharacterized repeat protein (TIGR03803 family)
MKSNQFWTAVIKALAVAIMTLIVSLLLATGALAAGKYKTLHVFTGSEEGSPWASLIFDQPGNLYGTTGQDAFELKPNADGSWTESSLYALGSDGPLIFDGKGNLYGTTYNWPGGGEVFELTPNLDGSWTPNVLYIFCPETGCRDGALPMGGLVFDQAGNLYGTTSYGGVNNRGTVFKLTLNEGGSWSESVLHSFTGGRDGAAPESSLILDKAGNLYGTTLLGGANVNGVVFKLTPNANGTWAEKVLHQFTGGKDGGQPRSGVIFDSIGNLYGTTQYGGTYGEGVVFKLVQQSNGNWTEKVLHQFTGNKDGSVPYAGVIFDQAGNLLGTTYYGGAYGRGVAFRLTPNAKSGWNETVLHAFAKQAANPAGGLITDKAGNLYGTTSRCDPRDQNFNGSVFELTP